jgi:hypothetical protein
MAGMDPYSALDPSLPLAQQQAQQAQAYAQMLRQQAMQPINPAEMVSGRVVRVNPLQPMAQMLMAYMGGRQQDAANEQTAALAARQSDLMRSMIFGPGGGAAPAPAADGTGDPTPMSSLAAVPPTPSPAAAALGTGAQLGSVGPTQANAARMSDMLRQPAPAAPAIPQTAAPAAPAAGPMAMPGMDPQKAMAALLMGGPEAYVKELMSRTDNRTELTKTLTSAGIDPASPQGQQIIRDNVTKQNYIAPTSLRPGGYVQNPNGTREQLPQVPEGFQAVQTPQGWQIVPVPGGVGAMTAATAAKESGKAPFALVEGFDPKTGAPFRNYAGNVLTPPPVPGLSGVPQVQATGGAPVSAAPSGAPNRVPQGLQGNNYGADSLAILAQERTAMVKNPKTTPADLAAIDREIARVSPQVVGPSKGLQTGPALGQAATADALGTGTAKNAVQAYNDLHTQATTAAPRAIGLLQSIEQLADKTTAGAGANSIQFVNGVLQTLGLPIGKDSAQNFQLMSKNLNMLVGAQRSAAGGGGTDALQSLLEAANPNAKTMNAPALKEAAQELIAYQRMMIAKDRAAPNPNTTSPQAYADFETKFAPMSDPRLWQIEHAADDKERLRILSLMPASERPEFLKKAKQAKAMGVLQ